MRYKIVKFVLGLSLIIGIVIPIAVFATQDTLNQLETAVNLYRNSTNQLKTVTSFYETDQDNVGFGIETQGIVSEGVFISSANSGYNSSGGWKLLEYLTISCCGAHSYFGPLAEGEYKVVAYSGAIKYHWHPWWTWHSNGTKVSINGNIFNKIESFATEAEAEAYWKGEEIILQLAEGEYIDGYFRDGYYPDNSASCIVAIYAKVGEEKDQGAGKPDTDQGDDPVNITNGNMYSTTQDLFIPGKGLPLKFTRTYNSKSFYNELLGYGWTHSYNIFLTENPDGTITEKDEDGTLIDFVYENAWEEGILNKVDISTGEVELKKSLELNDLPYSSNVQAFWKFEEASGTIYDETANNNDGTYNGNLYQQTGKVGYALGFDGMDDYVNCGTDPSLNIADAITIAAWVKTPGVSESSFFVVKEIGSVVGDYRWGLYFSGSGTISLYIMNSSGTDKFVVSTNTFDDDEWHYVVGTFDGRYLKFYSDGILETTTDWGSVQTIQTGGTLHLGAWKGYSRYFNGSIDEVAIWDKALAADEIASLYELNYSSLGTLNLKHDAGSTQSWQSYSFTGDESNGTNIKARFRSADTQEGLEGAAWSQYYDAVADIIFDVPDGQWIEVEATLESDATQTYSPTLSRLTINYSGGSKTWEAGYKAWDRSIIIKNPDDTYTLTRKHGTMYNFDSSGRLTSIVDRNNNQVSLSYADGLLTTITDTSGRVVSLSYLDGKVTQITDSANRIITYGYDVDDNLIQVTNPAGNSTTYAYDADHNLITITDTNENHTYFTYDAQDWCTETKNDEDNQKFSFNYDPANSTTIMTDANGNQTIFVYDSEKGVVTSITDALGKVTTSTWDEDINRTSITDGNDNTTYFTYDDMGNVISITDPLNNITSFTYEPTYNLVTSITNPLNQVTQYTYDDYGNLTVVTDALSNATLYTYDNYGNLLALKDARDNITSYNYDSYGDLIEIIDPLGNNTSFSYNILGNVLNMTDARNNTTSYVYDELNRLTKIIYPDTTEVNYTYDGVGNRLTVTDPNNHTTSYVYDVVNRLTQVTDALSNITSYVYDKMGNRLSITDANSNTTQYQYDALNRLIKTITPLVKETTYQYDAVGNRISTTDANGNTTAYNYDANNRLINITYQDGSIVEFGYDATGKRISMLDSTGLTAYTYDELNRLISVDGPGANDTISYSYDSVGNRISMTDQNGGITNYEYDALNRLIKLTDPEGNLTSYSYDEVSNLTGMVYPNNTETSYTFDNLNRLLTLTNQGSSGAISSYAYEYDPAGMRTRATLSDGSYVNYQYDALNRLIDETKRYPDESLDYFNGFTFDPASNRTILHRSTLRIEQYDFNRAEIGEDWQAIAGWWLIEDSRVRVHDARADAQLVYQKEISSNPTIEAIVNDIHTGTNKVSGIILSYLPNSNFYYAGMKIHDGKSPNESSWTIGIYLNGEWVELANAVDEIQKNQDYSLKVVVNGEHVSLYVGGILKLECGISGFSLGKVGLCCEHNLTEFDDFKVTIGSEEYIDYLYNEDNQLLSETITPKGEPIPSRTYAYSYDNNGNLIQKDDSEAGITTYGYDYENRLLAITYPDGTSDSYTYDGVSKRIQTTENGVITNYLYDGLNAIIEKNDSEMTLTSYVRGLSYGGGIGGIISKITPTTADYYHYDGIGGVTGLTDSTGQVIQSYTYDAYGNLLTQQIPTPHGFSTKEYSAKSGLIYFGARYYDPRVGRFITKDPLTWRPDDERILGAFLPGYYYRKYEILYIGEEYPRYLHRYVYCANNPSNSIDLYGDNFLSKLFKIYNRLPSDLIFPKDANEGADFTQEELDRRKKSWEQLEAERIEDKKARKAVKEAQQREIMERFLDRKKLPELKPPPPKF